MKITKDSLKELIKEELDLYTEEREIPSDVAAYIKDLEKMSTDLYMKYVFTSDTGETHKTHSDRKVPGPREGVVARSAEELRGTIEAHIAALKIVKK